MHHQKKPENSSYRDNKAFEDEEKRNNSEHSDIDIADSGLTFRKSLMNGGSESDNQDKQVYKVRDHSITSMHHSTAPDLFIEFDYIYLNPRTNTYCWVEGSRWMIYEEDYDIELTRFGSPHLSTMSIKGLKAFRKLFKNGNISIGDDIKSFLDVLKVYSDSVAKSGNFTKDEIIQIREALALNHYHAGMHLITHFNMIPKIKYNENRQCFESNENHIPQLNHRKSRPSLAENMHQVHSHKKLSAILNLGTEGLLVQVGTLESIHKIHSLFIRLEAPIKEEGLMDTLCPVRFVYMLFGPKSREEELLEVGRVFSILMSNREFREIAYYTDSTESIIEASKRFVDCSALIHLNKRITAETLANCFPHLRKQAIHITAEHYQKHLEKKSFANNDNFTDGSAVAPFEISGSVADKQPNKISSVMKQFIPPFHQVYLDLKGMKRRYLSDYRDAFTAESAPIVFTGFIFVYFVVLSPAITFGALFNALGNSKMTITMLIVASGTFQFLYAILSGQPLEIVGVTPTIFVVEQVLSKLAIDLSVQLDVMRFWIGVYVSAMGLIFTMFNGAVIIQHFRRSVEEVYNTYLSTIFILSSLFTMFKALPYTPVTLDVTTNATVYYKQIGKFGIGGSTLFLALVMLNCCLYLVRINRGIYLRRSVRKLIGAFNVPLGIILIVALSMIFFPAYQMPTLNIPASNDVNVSMWVSIPSFSAIAAAPGIVHGLCIGIGISMFFMLLVEVSTNSICVVKAERKLEKHTLYSLNYFIIIVLFPLISIFLGWPFYSGAMVRSNAHCLAMAKWSLNTIPGVPKKVIGECEQRISGMLVGLIVFLSVFLGSVLRYIPMASMYGMFLYMGVMGVSDMVLWKRLVNLLQRRKHWKEHDYLKNFPTWNIRILVSIQLFFVIILIILYILSQFTANVWVLFLFPAFVGMYAIIRGYILPHWTRLNTHLSKMDKKHVVKLYDGEGSFSLKDDEFEKVVQEMAKETEPDQSSTSSETHSEIY